MYFHTKLKRQESFDSEQAAKLNAKFGGAAYQRILNFRKNLPSFSMKGVSCRVLYCVHCLLII